MNQEDGTDIRPYEKRKFCGISKRTAWVLLLLTPILVGIVWLGVYIASSSSTNDSSEPTVQDTEQTSEPEQMNVLLFILDDAGWADLSFTTVNAPDDLPYREPANPYMLIETPNIDAFFAESAFYSNFHSSIVCTPSRASMYTGRYVHNLGMQIDATLKTCDNGALPMDVSTWAEYTAARGYTNYLFGKWNVGMPSWQNTPLGRGWHSFLGSLNHPYVFRVPYFWSPPGDDASYTFDVEPSVTANVENYDKCLAEVCTDGTRAGTYTYVVFNATSETCYCTDTEPVEDLTNDARDMTLIELDGSTVQDWWRDTSPEIPAPGKNADDLIIEETLQFLEDVGEDDGPWTLTVAITTPHMDQSYPPNGTYSPIYSACEKFFDVNSPYYEYHRACQCQRMVEIDNNFAQVLEKLEAQGLWENTLVILANDNNPNPGQSRNSDKWTNYGYTYPFRGYKGSWFQGGVQTFLGIGGGALPETYKGTIQTGLHDMVDILPTILAAAGYSSEDLPSDIDGTPLLDLNGVDEKPHEYIYHWGPLGSFDAYEALTFDGPNGTVLRIGDWKYFDLGMLFSTGEPGLGWYTLPATNSVLWDMETDPCYDDPKGGCFYHVGNDPYETNAMLPSDVPTEIAVRFQAVLRETLYAYGFREAMDYSADEDDCVSIEYGGYTFYPPWLGSPEDVLQTAG